MRLRARGLYHRSGIAPCPEGLYAILLIIPCRGDPPSDKKIFDDPEGSPLRHLQRVQRAVFGLEIIDIRLNRE